MADTLKFGPEWLRQLSGGNVVSTPPPSPAPGFGKYKLADYRYGREEMLALFVPPDEMPDELKQFTPIITEKAQEPLAFQQLSEEEQRIMSQSVNSTAVLRMMGRGAPPMRGRGGGGIERGRGRGRGRGEGFVQRGVSYDETGEGGFGRPRPRTEGPWEESGQKYQRGFSAHFDQTAPPNKMYQRSLSSENWRDRDDDDDDGDWRKAGSKWNNNRGNWRDRREGGFDYDRAHMNNSQKGFGRQYQRSRSSESWDEEEMPEWSMDGGPDELGTFDSSGAFVTAKLPPQKGKRGDGENGTPPVIDEALEHEMSPVENRSKIKDGDSAGKFKENGGKKDINENQTIETNSEKSVQKTPGSRDQSKPNSKSAESVDKSPSNHTTKTSKSNSSTEGQKPSNKVSETSPKPGRPSDHLRSQSSQKSSANDKNNKKESESAMKKPARETDQTDKSDNVFSKVPKDKSTPPTETKKREKLKSEAEALEQLQETVETMVAGITVMDDDDEETKNISTKMSPSALPKDHENYSKWFYRDPQGDLQGPFASSEMAEWFSAGYFTMNLLVRRGCDEKFSPLGDLIKRWGRVPFLPGQSPPPLMNSAHSSPDVSQQQQQQLREQQEQIQALQQQYLMQQQLAQQQMLMRQLQIQQMSQIMSRLQESDSFKSLPPLQQQQVVMQMMMKQTTNPLVNNPLKLSPRSSDDTPVSTIPTTSSPQSFHRSLSTPNTSQGQNLPTSIWDIEPSVNAADLEAQMKEKQLEEERKYQESLERQKELIRKEQEELQRQKEEIEKQRLEIERKKQEEMKKLEEEHRRKMEEEKKRIEEEHRRMVEEKRKAEEEEERQRLKREEELRRQEMEREMKQQEEIQKQQEAKRLKEEEEKERQKQLEIQRRQELQRQEEALRKQQQEALRKLQQEQMANIQLPSHAQWASSQPVINSTGGKSLLEIQQQEEKERIERAELLRQQEEFQRQQQQLLQQQQQQQKSWTKALNQPMNTTKSLLEIQEEQARQLERERKKREENQQQTAKNLNIGAASVWSGTSPTATNWANEGAWGAMRASGQINNLNIGAASVWSGTSPTATNWANEGAWGAMRASGQINVNNANNNNNLGFWDDAIISSSGPVKKQPAKPTKPNAEFPALGGDMTNRNKPVQNKVVKPSKQRKEEDTVKRLFQTAVKQEDGFTQWCESQLRSMDTSVDVPTFIAFLQEVESPYEVHDYVRSYLGESRMAEDFGKAFLEKRSQYRNRAKPVEEDSIWGPAPAITPRELRQPNPNMYEESAKSKASKKKKNKGVKVDSSFLGFRSVPDPNRIVGEIEPPNPH